MKLAALDFEYRRPSDPGMGLLSCAIAPEGEPVSTFWLRDPSEVEQLILFLRTLRKTHILVGYEIQLAEARCLAALGLDPNDWQWRDLLAEWRWLRNETNEYKYGRIVKDGRAFYTVPPVRRIKKRMTEDEVTEAERLNAECIQMLKDESGEENVAMDEAGLSLLDCQYFFEQINLGQYNHAASVKKTIRDQLIVKGTEAEILSRKDDILEYNKADVAELIELAHKMTAEMCKVAERPHVILGNGELTSYDIDVPAVQLSMGDWCARLAKYAYRGIPLDKGRMEIFLRIAPELTKEIKESWNREHPENPLYRVGMGESFLGKRKGMMKRSPYAEAEYTKDAHLLQCLIDDYCKANGIESWVKTRKGIYATDKKNLSTWASGENLIKQLERHQGQLSNLKAFSANAEGEIEAMRYIGSDWKQRPDFGAHGTQTCRNAHKAKSFIFANAHWMRVLINPEPGMALVEADYSQQEVFIAGALTGDENLIRAYESGDVYLYYAQLTGMYPKDLPIPTEEERNAEWFKPYKKVRQISKAISLSIQYGAGAKSIANAVGNAIKEKVEPEKGLEWVNEYRETYSDYSRCIDRLREEYSSGAGITLPNGWRLGNDSPNILSASNLPVQGTGSVILQVACRLLDVKGINIVATMHDAITACCPEEQAEAVAETMKWQMTLAADEVLGRKGMRVGEAEIVRHGDYWIHGEKAERDWPKYRKYFEA